MPKYKVNEDIYDIPDDKVEIFLSKYPDATLVEEEETPKAKTEIPVAVSGEETVKTTPVVPDAVAGEEIASDMESTSEDGSLELQEDKPFKPVFSKTGQILNKPKVEKVGDDKDFEDFNFLEETGKKIKRSAVSIFGGINRIPTLLNEFKYSVAKGIINHGAANVPSIFGDAKKNIDKFDKLSAEEQQQILNNIFDQLPSSLKAKEGLKRFEESVVKAEEIETQLTQFDNTIGQAFAQGDIGEATARVVSEAIGSLPFMVEAMIPYVGIPLIVSQEAARASGEAQKEGDEINLKLNATNVKGSQNISKNIKTY